MSIKDIRPELQKAIDAASEALLQHTKELQRECVHPYVGLMLTEGACSSRCRRDHQEIYIRCNACGWSSHLDLKLHHD